MCFIASLAHAQETFQDLGLQATAGQQIELTYSVDSHVIARQGSVQDSDQLYRLSVSGETRTSTSTISYRSGWGNPNLWWHEAHVGLSHTDISTNWIGSINQEVVSQQWQVSGVSDVHLGFKTSLRVNPATVLTYGIRGGYSIQTTLTGAGKDYLLQELFLTHQNLSSPIGIYLGYRHVDQKHYFLGDNSTETVLVGAVFDPHGPWSFDFQIDQSDNSLGGVNSVTVGASYQFNDHTTVRLSAEHQSLTMMSFDAGDTHTMNMSVSDEF